MIEGQEERRQLIQQNKEVQSFRDKLTPLQYETLIDWLVFRPKFQILTGAMRSGKTFLMVIEFLIASKRFENSTFMITGNTVTSVFRNVLSIMQDMLGIVIKVDKYNSFKLGTNRCYIFGTDNESSYKTMRGFTSSLTMCNEISTSTKSAIDEAISRTSAKGSQFLFDTNPSSTYHWVYTDLVSLGNDFYDNGSLRQQVVTFSTFSNIFLDQEYINAMKRMYPVESTYYQRNLLGKYVNQDEGVIYLSFDETKHVIDVLPEGRIIEYVASIDFGYRHFGVLSLGAKYIDGKIVIIKTIYKQEKGIDFWKKEAMELYKKYRFKYLFCDSARPDYLAELKQCGLPSLNADKAVNEGIDYVDKMLRENRLLIYRSGTPKLAIEEFYKYVWKDDGSEKPVKENDDFMDTLRYLVYTLYKLDDKRKYGMYANVTARQNNSNYY